MKNFQKIDKEEYKELLEKIKFKTFFHSLEWLNFLEKEFSWLEFEYYLYKNLVLVFGKIGNKLISLPFSEYGGPLIVNGEIDFNDFEKSISEFKNFKIKFHPGVFYKKESDVSTHFLYLGDKSEKELFNSFRKTLKHSIQNANKDIKIKKCSNLKELKQFYNLYLKNLKRKKTIPYPFSIFKFLFDKSDILLAYYKGKIISGDLFLEYHGFVHYFFSASDFRYKKLGASYLILWGKIKSLIGKDIVFDFGAAPKGSALETFKRGWRGKEYAIVQLGIKRSQEKLRSSGLRNIYALLPNFVIKNISKKLIKYRL
ncbi:GNAT family N-acetyltransferase [Patescibacteria group bacterium]|nr:GNAT family N-acetyltransferase [Patescibacteria group bacterium]